MKKSKKSGYLWEAQKNKNAQTFHHWTDMKLMKLDEKLKI